METARRVHWVFMAGLWLLGAASGAACGDPEQAPEPSCEVGTLGCECAPADVCAHGPGETALVCDRGICAPARCGAGQLGCFCGAGDECDDPSAACRDGVCRLADCTWGSLHCECVGGTCNTGGYCDEQLGGGTCIDGAGHPGGACLEGGVCRGASVCDTASMTCEPCAFGAEGCASDAGRCDPGLQLVANRCLPPPPTVPENPQCWTPCRGDLRATDGSTRACQDGLLDGCIDDLECVEGACVAPGDEPPTCSFDNECPGFQRCIAGQCYSDCASATECPAGYGCHQRVCRAPCERTGDERDTCPIDQFCESEDGETGFCSPLLPPADESDVPEAMAGSFSLDRDQLVLSAGANASFRVHSDAPTRETFVIERTFHRLTNAAGETTDVSDPAAALPWLELRHGSDSAAGGDPLVIQVEPGCEDACTPVELVAQEPAGDDWVRWEGTLTVSHPALGHRDIDISASRGYDGRWVGSMVYLANFAEGGLETWRNGPDRDRTNNVQNALIRRWGAFRNGRLTGGLDELKAVLTATRTGSWAFGEVRDACASIAPEGECYLHDGSTAGVQVYTSNRRDAPIPTAATELPIALNLRATASNPLVWTGRVDSSVALHFAGDPAVSIGFTDDPLACDPSSGSCFAEIANFRADTAAGARFVAADEACGTGFEEWTVPWLVDGFDQEARVDPTGVLVRRECRASGTALAGANPIPDGRARARHLRLLDGALVDGDALVVLFEERLDSPLSASDPDGLSAYGYMLLERTSTALDASAFEGVSPPTSEEDPAALGVSCSPGLIAEIDGTTALTNVNVLNVANAVLTGRRMAAPTLVDRDRVHHLCEDTGLIDGGPDARGEWNDTIVECPPASRVRYFAFVGATIPSQQEIADLPCQRGYDATTGSPASCANTVRSWSDVGRSDMAFDLRWECEAGLSYCNSDRKDLLNGKTFLAPGETIFPSLPSAIEEAFRYKIRFRSPSGRTTGFVPTVCDPSSELTPYCYDPEAIAEVRDRVDCLMAIYQRYGDVTGSIGPYLSGSLGYQEDGTSPVLEDGFERLYSELLVMLGDDALTDAYRSRFDLANSTSAVFRGSDFEPAGIDLTGVSGHEMVSLHRAVQYYQAALDRLYDLAPVIDAALWGGDVGAAPAVITGGTVSGYLERVLGGAAQKARALAQIARRYQGLNRPDLARSVLERGYTASHLESVILSRLMLRIADRADASTRPAIESEIDQTLRRYRVAMTEMREVYESLSDEETLFGYPADTVFFPVRDDRDFRASNVFEELLRISRDIVDRARSWEDQAIMSDRSFETDSESFQSELVRLSRQYEERLSGLCGFIDTDEGVYPATRRHAFRDSVAASLGDPCGQMGTGEIYQQTGRVAEAAQQHRILRVRFANLQAEIEDEATRVDRQCGLTQGIADFEYERGLERLSMHAAIGLLRTEMTAINTAIMGPQGAAAAAPVTLLQAGIEAGERAVEFFDLGVTRWRTERECDRVTIDSAPLMRSKMRQLFELRLEAQTLRLRLRLAQSELQRLQLSARRIEQEMEDAEELAIRVEAAKNDPNIRMYRNSAMVNAEHYFELALRNVYRNTRVFEYFTSRSYADLDRLFAIRMAGRGEDNLDRYLSDLQEAFVGFELEIGAPATKQVRLSLRDDLLQIPLLDDSGRALTQAERGRLFRERLNDPALRNENGALAIPFATDRSHASICTRNHKIEWVEAQLIGSDLGDDQAEMWLWQTGTGLAHSVDDEHLYYRLSERLAVITPYFGRNQIFDPAVYRSYRFRDRPVVNTAWWMLLDQQRVPKNQDIVLDNLTDIALHVYYQEHTREDSSCRP